jgi:probable F420-dependent oxidoreductase
MTAKQAVGRVGIWSIELRSPDPAARGEIADAVPELEGLGYGAIWLGSSPSVDDAALLLDVAPRIVVATGIVNVWQYPANEVAARSADLHARHPERFVLGLGASHPEIVEGYQRPYETVRRYLDELDAAPEPVPARWRVLAALGPRMLGLARDASAGAHPYLVTVEHTAQAREILGPEPLLAPEVNVVLEAEPDAARAIARARLGSYLSMRNYTSSWRRLGFTDDDLREGGSDRLVDALFVWGDAEAIASGVQAYLDAGADHVALQVTRRRGGAPVPSKEWRDLAEMLGLTA